MDPLIVIIYLFLVSTYHQSINNANAGATPKGTEAGKFIMTEGIEEFFQESLSIFYVLFIYLIDQENIPWMEILKWCLFIILGVSYFNTLIKSDFVNVSIIAKCN